MQEPYRKTAYSKVGLMDEGNHMRSNQEHCGDCLPSGLQPFLVMEQSKRVKEFMQSYSMNGIMKKEGD